MISVRLQGKPFTIIVIQDYAPTSNAEEAEVEWFYEDLQDLLELTPKKDVLFIIGEWNAKVGSQETPGVTGKFELGIRNEAGQRLIEFCQENALVIANTIFQQHKRRLHTWTSPDSQHQNQIDYILCSQRWRSSIQSAKIRPGADCGSCAILCNSAFKWVYLYFSPLFFTSLLFTAICKASSESHFAFLHFFFLEMVLIPVSCSVMNLHP